MSEKMPDVLGALEMALCLNGRDWGRDRCDVFLYGVIVGWSDESLEELAQKHDLSPESVKAIKAYRSEFEALKAGRDGASFDVEKR